MTESFSGAACPLGTECTLPNQECRNGAGATVTTAGAGQTCACSANFAPNTAGACVASHGKLLHVTNRK